VDGGACLPRRGGRSTRAGEVAERSNAADCKSVALAASEVRILPSPPVFGRRAFGLDQPVISEIRIGENRPKQGRTRPVPDEKSDLASPECEKAACLAGVGDSREERACFAGVGETDEKSGLASPKCEKTAAASTKAGVTQW
jgi:hypothetical protein